MKREIPGLVCSLLLIGSLASQGQFISTTNADDTLTITAYSGAGGTVSVPGNIDGLTVTGIGNSVGREARAQFWCQ
jgi:hypothetical protein